MLAGGRISSKLEVRVQCHRASSHFARQLAKLSIMIRVENRLLLPPMDPCASNNPRAPCENACLLQGNLFRRGLLSGTGIKNTGLSENFS